MKTINARPHPGPLPQEREKHSPPFDNPHIADSGAPLPVNEQAGIAIAPDEFSNDVTSPSLSPGERAGVRASIHSTCAVLLVASLALTGCGHKESDSHAHESGEAEVGVTFNAKKGLLVPPATAKFIGLQVADVEERKIATTFQFSAQVFRAASEAQFVSLQPDGASAALASGNINVTDAAKLSEGQTVSARNARDGALLPARIVSLTRHLEEASGQIEVALAISDAPQPLAAGDFVSAIVPFGGGKNVVSVPRSAVFRTTEGDFVYTVSGEHFVRAPVKLGVADNEFVETTDGLYAGDQIVVRPVMMLWMAELQSLRGGKACADGH